MPERAAYYNAKSLTSQIGSGDSYDTLKKTITIVIADFEIVKNSRKYHHVFQLYDMPTGLKFTDVIEIDTLELVKIPIESDDTKKYQWLKFLKSEKEEEFQMLAEKNPVINKAVAKLIELSADEEAQLLYEAREKALRDERARYKTALRKGLAEGMAKGRAEGIISVARNMLKLGLPASQISEATGLSIMEINNISKQ